MSFVKLVSRSFPSVRRVRPSGSCLSPSLWCTHTVDLSRRSLSSSVNLALIKDLRAHSGAPIVECKEALKHAGDDLTAAMDWLREHGAAKVASKVEGRETNEGLVGLSVSEDGKSASLVKVVSETDFASRSATFLDFVVTVADATLSSDENGALSSVLGAEPQDKTVQEALDEAIVAIRENISVFSATRLKSDDGVIVGYVHNKVDPSLNAGMAAALIEVAPASGREVPRETLESVGKKLAMHVVAARPLYLNPESVPASDVERERSFLTKQVEDSGKPPDIVQKIVDGRMRKFYEGICLTEQAHMIEEQNPKVSKVLKDQGLALKRFKFLSVA